MAVPDHPTLQAASTARLEAVLERVRPLALAEQRVLPVLEPLQPLLSDGGLRRGTLVAVTAPTAAASGGATSLALALAAGPSAAGSWLAAVGAADLGLAAAAELGVALERVAVVDRPDPARWATVVAALLDAFDVVLVRPDHAVRAADARRLQARARERGAVLLAVGAALSGTEVHLVVSGCDWSGVGAGHGHLRARSVEVTATGRRAAARARTARLWLPGPDGGVAALVRPPPEVGVDGRRTVVPFPGRGITTTTTPRVLGGGSEDRSGSRHPEREGGARGVLGDG